MDEKVFKIIHVPQTGKSTQTHDKCISLNQNCYANNFMKKATFLKVDRQSATQITRLLVNMKIHCLVHKRL